MGKYDAFYKQFTDLNQTQRMNLCKNGVGDLMKYFDKRGYSKNKDFTISFFTSLIGYFIGADGTVTSNEAAIFNEIFGTHYTVNDLARYLPNLMSNDNFKALDEFIDSMDVEHKKMACYVVLAVISADGKITSKEAALFEKILA